MSFIVEEARKAEEAARKKQEQELKLKLEAEKKEAQKALEQKKAAEKAAAEADAWDKLLGNEDADKNKPILGILGKSKSDYLKSKSQKQQEPAADGKKPPGEAESGSTSSKAETEFWTIGTPGTIEFEYMTHWLEQQLEGNHFLNIQFSSNLFLFRVSHGRPSYRDRRANGGFVGI